MNKSALFEIPILMCIGLLSFIGILFFELNYIVSITLFLILPSILLCCKLKREGYDVNNLLLFCLYMMPFTICYDELAHVNNAWMETTVFPFRISTFPIENLLFSFFYLLLICSVYVCYFSKDEQYIKDFSAFKPYLLGIPLICLFLRFFEIPYFYFWINMTVIFFAILICFKTSKLNLLGKFVFFSLIGSGGFIMFEYSALTLGNWHFPTGNHLAYLPFIGGHAIPLEEYMFAFFTPIAVLAVYNGLLKEEA